LSRSEVNWTLAPWLAGGALLSVPFAAHTVKILPEQKIKIATASVITALGCLTLYKAIF
jgi:uncharacterized membrane protein YfcA